MNIYLIFKKEKYITLFDLEITQEEGSFAVAKGVIEAGISLPLPGSIGLIKGEELYFKGILVSDPLKIEGNFAEIQLLACPPNAAEAIKSLHISEPPYWDALWVKEDDPQGELQDVHPSSLYCDRRTWELKRSCWFQGHTRRVIRDHFFQESLRFHNRGTSLKSCTLKFHAHWIQKEEGVADLSSAIRRAFPHAKVNTYTTESLLKTWPSPGRQLGRSGVGILKSELKEVTPPSLMYPSYSPSFVLKEEGEEPRAYRVKRHWFKPTLWARWQYQQRQKERVVVTLHTEVANSYPGEGENEIVEFTLQNINPPPQAYPWRPACFYKKHTLVFYKRGVYRCKNTHRAVLAWEEDKWKFKNTFHTPLEDPARASFFLTDRGYQAAEHAMELAKAILAKRARSLEISFEAPREVVKDITTDTSLWLEDPRLPQGKGYGKVVKWSLIARGDTGERFGRVTLLGWRGRGGERSSLSCNAASSVYRGLWRRGVSSL